MDEQSPEPQKAFAAAKGVVEFSTDGLKINTVDGWREIRQSVISKRGRRLPATAEQWDEPVAGAADGADGHLRHRPLRPHRRQLGATGQDAGVARRTWT